MQALQTVMTVISQLQKSLAEIKKICQKGLDQELNTPSNKALNEISHKLGGSSMSGSPEVVLQKAEYDPESSNRNSHHGIRQKLRESNVETVNSFRRSKVSSQLSRRAPPQKIKDSSEEKSQHVFLMQNQLPSKTDRLKAKKLSKKEPPKRPMCAYFVFQYDNLSKILNAFPHLSAGEVKKQLGAQWAKMTAAEKQPYDQIYKQKIKAYKKELEKFRKENPQYQEPAISKKKRKPAPKNRMAIRSEQTQNNSAPKSSSSQQGNEEVRDDSENSF